jgi:hypothetical protein
LKKPKGLFAGRFNVNSAAKNYKFVLSQKKEFENDKDVIEKCLKDKLL